MAAPQLAYIVILNWNGWKDTSACVESCLNLSYANCRILIVDNGSSDGSESILRERFPSVDILQTGRNMGFAGGNNAGIRYALEQGAEFIWLLNNDATADPEALSELVRAVQADETIGIVGSKIFYFSQPDVIWFAGGWLRQCTGTNGHRGLLEKDKGQYDEITDVDYISGCSLLIKSTAIKSAGLMDERFFLLFEEVDWNQRVKEQGYRIVYVPASRVWHKVSMSISADSPAYHYYLMRNSLLFTLKHKLVCLPTVTAKRLMDIAYLFLHKRYDIARAGAKGLCDFYLFRFGQMRSSG